MAAPGGEDFICMVMMLIMAVLSVMVMLPVAMLIVMVMLPMAVFIVMVMFTVAVFIVVMTFFLAVMAMTMLAVMVSGSLYVFLQVLLYRKLRLAKSQKIFGGYLVPSVDNNLSLGICGVYFFNKIIKLILLQLINS